MAKRHSAAQIQAVPKTIDRDRANGLAAADSCHRHGIKDQSYSRWLDRATVEANNAFRQLRELASEVERLKQVADARPAQRRGRMTSGLATSSATGQRREIRSSGAAWWTDTPESIYSCFQPRR